jgi:hypothetical protein
MRSCVRRVFWFARSTYSPLKGGKFWLSTQSIWTVDEERPSRTRSASGVSSPRSRQTMPCWGRDRTWNTVFSPGLPPTGMKPLSSDPVCADASRRRSEACQAHRGCFCRLRTATCRTEPAVDLVALEVHRCAGFVLGSSTIFAQIFPLVERVGHDLA